MRRTLSVIALVAYGVGLSAGLVFFQPRSTPPAARSLAIVTVEEVGIR